MEYDRKKKEAGKRPRLEKEKVMDILFSAFEKHQFYQLKDLSRITEQPVVSISLIYTVNFAQVKSPVTEEIASKRGVL